MIQSVEGILSRIAADISTANTEISSNTDREWRTALEQKGVCPICGGMGFVTLDVPPGHPQFGQAVPCECKRDEIETRRLAQFRSISQLHVLREQTFMNFKPDGIGLMEDKQRNLRLAYEQCREYALRPEGWILLRGGFGCGKTHLAAAIANYQVESGKSAILLTVPDLLDFLRASFSPDSDTSYDERFVQIKTAGLLILDDFGTESGTPWAQEKLFQLLNYRYNAHLPTVITTNFELEEIDLRVRSRLVDPALVQIITILAPDFRRSGVAEEQSDLSSLNLHYDQTFTSFSLRQNDLPQAEQANLQRAFDLARTFAQAPENWLVLTGAYGCGKTHLAAAIANYWRMQSHPVLFISVPDLLDDLRATFSPDSSVSYIKRFKEVKMARFLVLDDLGVESATNWAREKMYQIFDYRYNARLPTVITTATPLDKLDNRLASRMLDPTHCQVFAIMVTSYRGDYNGVREPVRSRTRKSRSPFD